MSAVLLGLLLAMFASSVSTGPVSGEKRAVPTARRLAESVATVWGPLRLRLTARMTVLQPRRPPAEMDLLIRRAGSGRTRIDFLSPPKDRGNVLLLIGDGTWLYLQNADRVVQVPSRRNPLAGGAIFEDMFPDAPEVAGAVVEDREDAFVLVTSAAGHTKKETSRIYFDRATLLPTRREIYASSGRLLKTVRIEETRAWRGARIPWKVRFVDDLRSGVEASLEMQRVDELDEDVEALFSKERLIRGDSVGQ